METRAIVRGVRLSADKGRLVADMIRGKKVDQAINILTFTPKKAAGIVKKALEARILGPRVITDADEFFPKAVVSSHIDQKRTAEMTLSSDGAGELLPVGVDIAK